MLVPRRRLARFAWKTRVTSALVSAEGSLRTALIARVNSVLRAASSQRESPKLSQGSGKPRSLVT